MPTMSSATTARLSESHLQTPHFRKYKQGTLSMVRELELVDVNPLLPGLKIK